MSSGPPFVAVDGPALRIAFAERQVIVRSDAPEVLAALERTFGAMLASTSGPAVGQIQVTREGPGYDLPAEGETSVRGGSLTDVLACAAYHVKRLLVEANPELIWLHAGAAMGRAGAVLFVGGAGRGKSTLVTGLCNLDWCYLSDDLVALDPISGLVLPFRQAPAVRVGPGYELPADQVAELPKTEPRLGGGAASERPAPVAALIFPSFSLTSVAGLEPCPPSATALELLAHCINVSLPRTRAVRILCGLARDRPGFRLSYAEGGRAAEMVDQASNRWS